MHNVWIIFFCLVGVNFALLFFTVLTAGLHDIKSAKAQRARRKQSKPYQPHVTILVPAHNEQLVLERGLRSISALTYPHYNVIILNDGSTDNTSDIAKQFIAKHHLRHWEVIDLYPNLGKGGALNYALKHRKLGDLVTVIDADCVVTPNTLSNIVHHFDDNRVMASSANVRVNEERALLAYFQQIEYMIGYYHKRHNDFTTSEFIVGGQGATYRRDTLVQVGGFRSNMQTEDIDLSLRIAALGNKRNRLVYAADALIYTEAVPTISALYRQRYRWKFGAQQAIYASRKLVFSTDSKYTKLLTWFRIPQSIFGELRLFADLFLLALFIAIAVMSRSLWIFFGSWFTVTAYTTFVIAADQHTNARTKLELCLINPLLFPLHMGMTILNIAAAFQMVYNWKQLVGIKQASGSWTPPTRIGKAQLS